MLRLLDQKADAPHEREHTLTHTHRAWIAAYIHTLTARQSAAAGTCCAYFSANTYIIFQRFHSFFFHRILLPPFLLAVHVCVCVRERAAPVRWVLLFLILFALATL